MLLPAIFISCRAQINAREPRQRQLLWFFHTPLQLLLGGILGEDEASQLAFHSTAGSPTQRMSLKIIKKCWHLLLRMPRESWLAPFSTPSKVVWSPTWRTSLRAADPCEYCNGVNHFSRNSTGLSEFPDTLLLVILHFGGSIGDESFSVEVTLIHRHHWFSLLHLLIIAYTVFSFLSRPCHGRLLDNFLKSSTAFSECGEQFHKITLM